MYVLGLKDATKPKNNIYSKDILLGAQLCLFFVVKRLENRHSLLFYLASQYYYNYHIVLLLQVGFNDLLLEGSTL